MSALLDSLLTPTQRLMADNAEQRELIAALQERNAYLAELVTRHSAAAGNAERENLRLKRSVSELQHDLATLRGDNATPQAGCLIVSVPFEMGYLLCEVQGDAEELDVVNVFVNGRWLDPEDVRSAMDLGRLREQCADALREDA